MNEIYQTAIVGGGAAGIMAAVELTCGKSAFKGEDILLLERNDRVGKKLVATGNGQGNLTNAHMSADFYYGKKPFIEHYIANEKRVNLKKYLSDLGIILTESKDGKMYPVSKQASAVVDVLRGYLKLKGVKETVGSEVQSIEKRKDFFLIKTKDDSYRARTVIVAVGGAAAKQFGTDGTQYKLLENLGHEKTELYPSLVQLKTELGPIRGLKGLKETATVKAFVGAKEVKRATGDLLFTEFGVSGSSIFTVSSALAGKKDCHLEVEFVPELTKEQIEKEISRRKTTPDVFKENVSIGLMNKRIGQAVLKTAKSDTASDIARAVKEFRLSVVGNLGFNYAQVTRGGIVTDDIDGQTYQSKLHDGLYVVGEVLDVDGDCGGYNLAFAFVSAITAARSIKRI